MNDKLTLNRETLCALSDTELAGVAGGATLPVTPVTFAHDGGDPDDWETRRAINCL
jgi:hypothetical protein